MSTDFFHSGTGNGERWRRARCEGVMVGDEKLSIYFDEAGNQLKEYIVA